MVGARQFFFAECVGWLRVWMGVLALVLGASVAEAANFTVSPVRVELSAAKPSVALTVKNEVADESVIVQLQVVAWSQHDGSDVFDATNDLIATPPIFTIAGGASQIIRVGLRHPMPDGRELSYRIFLREVPPPPKPDFAGVQIALELSLPVFVKPKASTAPALQWKAERQSDTLKLTLQNGGSAHVQVANLQLYTAGNEQPVTSHPEFAYVLPGQTRVLTLKLSPGQPSFTGGSLHLKAYSDAGDVDSDLVVESR